VMRLMSHVTCHLSPVTYHMSPVTRGPRRRQARQKLSRRFQSKLPTPRKLVWQRPGVHAVSLGLLVLSPPLLYWFGTDDLFFGQSIGVEGNTTISAAEVVRASGAANFNIFFLQFEDIENKVRALPGVQVAQVTYEWPNLLHISVSERKSVFVWESNK